VISQQSQRRGGAAHLSSAASLYENKKCASKVTKKKKRKDLSIHKTQKRLSMTNPVLLDKDVNNYFTKNAQTYTVQKEKKKLYPL